MKRSVIKSLTLTATMMLSGAALAQPATPPASPPPPAQYGTPGVTLDQAEKAVAAAIAEAKKNGWFMAVTVVSNGGHLVQFSKMDNTQFASIDIAQHKARVAATFRRPTKAFQDGVQANPPNLYLLTLDGMIAVEGGMPLMRDGKIIGAIGCSGGTGPQDSQTCKAGVDALH
ncbi:MAG: GlcG/HbpS family heme-binding protein [Xanthobacteraceae bacterium]